MTVNETLIELLNKVCEKIGVFIDWTSQQAIDNLMPYITQLFGRIVKFEIVTSVIWIIFSIIMCCVLCKLFSYSKKRFEASKYNKDGWWFLCTLVVLVGITMVIVFCAQVFDIVTAITFPELTVIEFIKPYIN